MKKLSTLLLVLLALITPVVTFLPGYGNAARATVSQKQVENVSSFEQAVQIIKKYEGLHSPKHWPLIGYGHMVLPGEKYSRSKALSEKEAEALLRKDLLKNCAVFREFGKDSLLLGVLAYNIGSGNTLKSSVVKKLKAGNRDIKENYLAHSKYRGKTLSGLKKRRVEEFEALFITDGEMKDIVVETDTTVSTSMANSESSPKNDGQGLFASILSPVRLMFGALANPFRLTAQSFGETENTSVFFNQPLTDILCAPSI